MRKSILIILLFLPISLLSQSAANQQQAQFAQVIKPVFYVEDVFLILQVLNTIELTGNEIDQFLGAKKFVQTTAIKAQQKALSPADTISAEAPVQTAQDLLTFLQRGKFTGQSAEKYKRFIDAIVEAARKFNQQQAQKK